MLIEPMSFRSWLKMNRLPLLLMALVPIGVLSFFGYEVLAHQFIYWWSVFPQYGWTIFDLMCLPGIALILRLRNLRRDARILLVAISFALLVQLWFLRFLFVTPAKHVSSVTFHDHVYHLSINKVMSAPDRFALYECDEIGWWCHPVDTIYDDSRTDAYDAGPHSMVLVVDDTNDILFVVATGLPNGTPAIIQKYAYTTHLEPIQAPPGP